MCRIRIIFEKRGLITFLNHMDLPELFSRAARRAGLIPELTKGFSPHPRISFGPSLVSGVEGLAEPAEFWFGNWDCGSAEQWNKKLPLGLKILKYTEVDGPALAKLADSAQYIIEGAWTPLTEKAYLVLKTETEKSGVLYRSSFDSGVIRLCIGDLGHCGAGNLVQTLVGAGLNGWPELRITRSNVGRWSAEKQSILPLV